MLLGTVMAEVPLQPSVSDSSESLCSAWAHESMRADVVLRPNAAPLRLIPSQGMIQFGVATGVERGT